MPNPVLPKRFRVAFSFAGQKRDFVEEVATLLKKQFSEEKILYDKFHKAEFARDDLVAHLTKLYRDQSDLIVAVLCPDYEKKEWCGLEWKTIRGLLKKAPSQAIMLTRFDHVEPEAMEGLAGYVDLDRETPDSTAALILERLALNEGKSKDHYTKDHSGDSPRSGAQIPNNLPRLQYFFGREADLKKIADTLAPDARTWGALIDGPGGIGKTTLAIRAAELLPSGRFERIIFLSSKERELTADGQRSLGHFVLPTYLEILNAIARELGQLELVKLPDAERSEAILRALREAEVLLVLDNLETLPAGDRDQLFAFLNRLPRGCSAIVTSRRRADAGAVNIRLDRLNWEAARQFIEELGKQYSRLGEASEVDKRALYEETGGNPLLIRWVAAQLGHTRYHSVGDALVLLRSPEASNNPLEFIFGDLLDTFTASETKVLAALTHFSAPAAAKFIAELGSINEEAAQGALSDLSGRALVLPDSEERCFLLVPMVADFLRRKKPEIVAETADRLEKCAYGLIVENGYSKHERFPLLEAAWSSVAPALPLFLAGPNERLQTVCSALVDFLNFTGRWDELLSLSEQAEAKALADNDHNHAGWRAYESGWVQYLREQADAVLACASRADAHWHAAETGPRERSIAIRLRGIGNQLKENYAAAIADFREVLELRRTLSAESEDIVIALNALAAAEDVSGDFDAADRDYCESLRVARALGFTEGAANITANRAGLALSRKNWLEAETLAREALPLAEKVGRLQIIASSCDNLAKALVQQGKGAEGLPYARRALAIYEKIGSPDLEGALATLRECEASPT